MEAAYPAERHQPDRAARRHLQRPVGHPGGLYEKPCREIRDQYDYIFFDSPPILGVTDASILAGEVDGVLLVVQYRKYPKIISLRAKRMVENAGGHLLGAVLNNINIMRDDYYYYYHYTTKKYYGSSRHDKDDEADEA